MGHRQRIGPVIAFVAVVSLLTGAAPASAGTQLWNEYPNSPTSCTGVNPYKCIEWPTTSGGLSVNVDVYLESTLDLITQVPFKADLRASLLEWNNVAARNPHLQETTNPDAAEVYVWASM